MKKIEKIEHLLKRALGSSSKINYQEDYKICKSFILKRDFDKLQELLKSIINSEGKLSISNRLINFELLIEAKVLVDEYIEQLTYTPSNDE